MVLAGMVLVIYVHCRLSFLIWDVAPAMETRHLQTSASIHPLLQAKISHDSVLKNAMMNYQCMKLHLIAICDKFLFA